MIKIIASDLDGTLLQNGAQALNPGTAELIHELTKQGRIFVASSGRQYPNLRRLFEPVKDEIAYICENGSLVMYKDEIIAKHVIDRQTGQEIFKAVVGREGSEVLLSGVHTCYIQPKDPAYLVHLRDVVKNNVTVVDDILQTPEDYLKISVFEKAGIENSWDYWKERFGDRVTVVTSGMAWLDTVPRGVNKGKALTGLMELFGFQREDSMAFGDNYNDIEMLEIAGYGFAMDNAREGVRKLCHYKTHLVEDTLKEVLGGKYD